MTFDVVADLSNPAKWHLVYEQYRIEQPPFPPRFPRIEGFLLPFTFERYVFACSVSTEKYKDTWFTGGWFTQRVEASGTDFGRFEAQRIRVPLNRTQLMVLPKVAPQYQLYFDPGGWLIDFTLRIWEYTGEETSREEDLLQAVRVDLARVEFKVDTLL